MLVRNTTLDTTYMVQIQHRDGTWAFNDQGEWDSYAEANSYGAQSFGPDCPHRVIEVTRRIVGNTLDPQWSPRFPEGTPEYDAYAGELRAELDRFAHGEI